jgi:hypothetical protein
MRVALVPNIPDDFIDGNMEDFLERGRQLDDPEIRRKVAAHAGDRLDQALTQLYRKRLQLSAVHRF